MTFTSGAGYSVTRAAAFLPWTISSISCTLASNSSNISFFIFPPLYDHFQCLLLLGRQVVLLVLGIRQEHVDMLISRDPVVDGPDSTTFAPAFQLPADFP